LQCVLRAACKLSFLQYAKHVSRGSNSSAALKLVRKIILHLWIFTQVSESNAHIAAGHAFPDGAL